VCSEQIHLSLGGPTEAVVSFATLNDLTPSTVEWWAEAEQGAIHVSSGSASASSSLQSVDVMLTHPSMGDPSATIEQLRRMQNWSIGTSHVRPSPKAIDGVQYGLGAYNNPRMIYDSPVIHTVHLSPLTGGLRYRYRVAGDARTFAFTMPPTAGAVYPYVLGLTADLGQTAATEANLELLQRILLPAAGTAGGEGNESSSSIGGVLLIAGDLSYADGWGARWDSFGRLFEPLAARVPVLTVGGNHEIAAGENWQQYNLRYPMPFRQSGSLSNLWWSREVGPAHVIGLCSYCACHKGSLQQRWLRRDLASIDREATPWVVVLTHVPFYHSSTVHAYEAELMRYHIEGLLFAFGVDLVLAGHLHAYERTEPLFAGVHHPCGPIHLTLGDGGNREGAALPWRYPPPSWSAFREGTFGVGGLTIVNATHAK
jgi:hypothetical protein